MYQPLETPSARADPEATEAAPRVLRIVAEFCREVRESSGAPRTELDSNLERDLGLDSLERAELLLRLERAFDVRLPARTLAIAETPRDLVRAALAGTERSPQPSRLIVTPIVEQESAIPDDATTLPEVLEWHARAHPRRTLLTLLAETDTGPSEQPLTYGDLLEEAARVASGLGSRGIEPGQTVALMLPTARDFFVAFFGILLAGGIPVPLYPPARRSQLEDHLRRQSGILANCLAVMLITVPEALGVARLLRASTRSLREIVSVAELDAAQSSRTSFRPAARDIAFLQYTSGSTGSPKGVILSHANLLANIRAMGRAAGALPTDVFVSWLPLYHDMGLIGAWLGTLYHGVPLVVMSPTDFLGRPESWLWAIHRYRGTLSGAPNFAYEICATRLDDRRIAGLDLSSWRVAYNGAEPVSPDTLLRFGQRFAAYGFNPRTQAPVYGLAESAVGLTFPPLERGPLIDRVDRGRLASAGEAIPVSEDAANARRIVCCGGPLPGHEIRVIDDAGHECPDRHEGRIEFRGPSATSGYFRNPDATRRLFDGGWLDTGDLGYVAEGELYVTGRAKDIIIRGGQHIHPQEAEAAIGNIPGIRKGCVTLFGTPDPAAGTEKVVVLAETRESDPEKREALRIAVVELATTLLGAPPDDVVLAPPHTVLKTSSGKVRRAACGELYRRGMTGAGPRALWPQVARLLWTGAAGWTRGALGRIGEVAFGIYVWLLLAMAVPVALTLAVVLPRLAWRRHAAAMLARALVRASTLPVQVRGTEHFPAVGPLIVVANHASYIDGLMLTTCLPERCNFVAKRELTENFATRLVLRGIGTRFVERFDVEASVESAHDLNLRAAQGESFAFFSEGTFRRESGLREFHLGAFVAAASAGIPVVPVALRGTRSVLRDGQWLPRRGLIQIVVMPPLVAEGRDWAAAVRLRERTRTAILGVCGEPDLAERRP
jgi:1-acyl-sn-glycerol-3-phosphate acyltransferase